MTTMASEVPNHQLPVAGALLDQHDADSTYMREAMQSWISYRQYQHWWMQNQFSNYLLSLQTASQMQPNVSMNGAVFPASYLNPNAYYQPVVLGPGMQQFVFQTPQGPALAPVNEAAGQPNYQRQNVVNEPAQQLHANLGAEEENGDVRELIATILKALSVAILLSFSPSALRFAIMMAGFVLLQALFLSDHRLRNRWNLRRRRNAAAANIAAAAANPPQQRAAANNNLTGGQPAPGAAGAAAGNRIHDEGDVDDDDDEADDADSDEDENQPDRSGVGTAPAAVDQNSPNVPEQQLSLILRTRHAAVQVGQFALGFVQSMLPDAPN